MILGLIRVGFLCGGFACHSGTFGGPKKLRGQWREALFSIALLKIHSPVISRYSTYIY